MCKGSQETIQEADRAGMFKSVGQCQHDSQFYSCSASYDYVALMTSLGCQASAFSSLNQVLESLPHRFVMKM